MIAECRILVADTQKAVTDLQGLLKGTRIELLHAHTFDDAVQIAREKTPHLFLVGYHFDEGRPYRLIQHLRSEHGNKVPIILIRALPLPQPERDEAQIKDSYRSLGANDYLPLYDEARRDGWDSARARLAGEITRQLQDSCSL